MKRLICIVLVLITLASLTACGGAKEDAQNTFEAMMSAFKSGDRSEIDKYYSFDMLTTYIEEKDGKKLEASILSTLKKMDYKVNSAERTSSGAVKLNVDITTVDFSKIAEGYIKNVMELVKTSEYKALVRNIDDEKYEALMVSQMISAIENCPDERVTKTVDVTMIKGETGWILGGEPDEFMGALFEDMSNLLEALI